MPFIVEQINVIFWAFVALFLGWLTLLASRHATSMIGILLTFGIAYWLPAMLFAAFPFHPYRGLLDRRGRGNRLPTIHDLTEVDRRVLVCFYDPRNRRRAAGAIVAVSAVLFALAETSRVRAHSRGAFVDPASFAGIAAFGLTLAFLTGLFAITIQIRRDWPRISSDGAIWPADVEYPGPVAEGIRSFFTGDLPVFLAQTRKSST